MLLALKFKVLKGTTNWWRSFKLPLLTQEPTNFTKGLNAMQKVSAESPWAGWRGNRMKIFHSVMQKGKLSPLPDLHSHWCALLCSQGAWQAFIMAQRIRRSAASFFLIAVLFCAALFSEESFVLIYLITGIKKTYLFNLGLAQTLQ